MKEKEYKDWKESREKGKSRYLIQNGMLAYGMPMFVVMTFIVSKAPETGYDAKYIITNFLLWSAAGLLFGFIMWSLNEKSFIKESQKRENT